MQIKKETIHFLAELKQNNTREWFAEQRSTYEAALDNVRGFIAALIPELAKYDPHIHTDINPHKCLFRIYRDTRFSKDKTPYKSWFSAGISIDSRKLDGPEYYLHIAPETSYIACGYWRPNKTHLDMIRQEIDYNEDHIKQILQQLETLPQYSLDLEDKLKRPPAGYEPDHSAIELLKLKSFVVSRYFSAAEVLQPNFLSEVVKSCQDMYALKLFIHEAIAND